MGSKPGAPGLLDSAEIAQGLTGGSVTGASSSSKAMTYVLAAVTASENPPSNVLVLLLVVPTDVPDASPADVATGLVPVARPSEAIASGEIVLRTIPSALTK